MIGRTLLAFALLLTAATAYAGPPEDAASFHLVTVTANPASPTGQQLLQDIDTHPQLSAIAGACKRFAWTTADPIYRARYAAALPPTSLPIVALIRSDGGVIYKASGPNIPQGDDLAATLTGRAYLDRKANPRPIPNVEYSQTPPGQPDSETGLRPLFPDRRPVLDRVIPDTVNVTPTFELSDKIGYAIATVVGLVFLCVAILAFALGGAVLLLRS